MSLTVKQESFARGYVESGCGAEAYRASYNPRTMKDKTIHEAASRLLKNSKVKARVAELQALQTMKHLDSVEDIAKMLKEDRKAARIKGQMSAAISATMGWLG